MSGRHRLPDPKRSLHRNLLEEFICRKLHVLHVIACQLSLFPAGSGEWAQILRWPAPKASHHKASHLYFPHFPRFAVSIFRIFHSFRAFMRQTFLRPLFLLVEREKIRIFRVFARSDPNCKMRKIRPTGLTLTGIRCNGSKKCWKIPIEVPGNCHCNATWDCE